MLNNKSVNVKDVVKQVVDTETGEVVEQTVEKHFVRKVESESFFMVFFENFGAFLGLSNASDIKLMASMCSKADFNTGLVRLSSRLRSELCEEASVSKSNISKNLKRLSDAGLIIPQDGDYLINPKVFWKGTMKSRMELLEKEGLSFSVKLVGA